MKYTSGFSRAGFGQLADSFDTAASRAIWKSAGRGVRPVSLSPFPAATSALSFSVASAALVDASREMEFLAGDRVDFCALKALVDLEALSTSDVERMEVENFMVAVGCSNW